MICLVCSKCGKIWYTANTKLGQDCDECKGELIERNSKAEVKAKNEKRN